MVIVSLRLCVPPVSGNNRLSGGSATNFFGVKSNSIQLELASYPGHVGGGKSGLVSTVCACTNPPPPMFSWGIVYHHLQTINLIALKRVCFELILQTCQVKVEDFDKVLKFALRCIGKGNFTLKAE